MIEYKIAFSIYVVVCVYFEDGIDRGLYTYENTWRIEDHYKTEAEDNMYSLLISKIKFYLRYFFFFFYDIHKKLNHKKNLSCGKQYEDSKWRNLLRLFRSKSNNFLLSLHLKDTRSSLDNKVRNLIYSIFKGNNAWCNSIKRIHILKNEIIFWNLYIFWNFKE